MKRIICCALALMSCTYTIFADNHKLGTFNTRIYAVGDTEGKDWQIRGPHCSDVVKKYDLDVVGFQELCGEGKGYYNPATGRTQLDDMKAWLPEYEFHAWDRDGTLKREYVAVAFKKSRYEFVEEGSFFVSTTPDKFSNGWDTKIQPIPRVVGWVKLKEKSTGETFIFASAHTNNGWSLDGPYGSMVISQRIKDVASGLPVMIVGDFNTNRGLADAQIGLKAYQASFLDAAKEVTASQNFSVPVTDRKVTWTYNGYHPISDTSYTGTELDYHFYRGMDIMERHIITDQFDFQGTQYPVSDHFPVYVVAELNPDRPNVIYVDCNASKGGDGSIRNPFTTINEAVSVARIDDTVLVASGEYNEFIAPGYTVAIEGGYDADFIDDTGETIISGKNLKSSPINVNAYISLRLKNLIIKGYKSTSGTKDGAVRFNGSDLILENVRVEDNSATVFGGGICAYQAGKLCSVNNITLRNCVFRNNKSSDGGAIAASTYGNLLIEGCSFEGNTATKTGSAAYLSFGSVDEKKIWFTEAKTLIINSSFTGNNGGTIGALYINDNMPNVGVSVLNTTFAANTLNCKSGASVIVKGYAGAAVCAKLCNAPANSGDNVSDSRLNMAHVTVVGNNAVCTAPENFVASAVNIVDGGKVKILNSIIAGNHTNGTHALSDLSFADPAALVSEGYNLFTDREGCNIASPNVSSEFGVTHETGLANLCNMMDGMQEGGMYVPTLIKDKSTATMYVPLKSKHFGGKDLARIDVSQRDFQKEFGDDVNTGGLIYGKLDFDQLGAERSGKTIPGALEYIEEGSGVTSFGTTNEGYSLSMQSPGVFTLRGESGLDIISVYDASGLLKMSIDCNESEAVIDISDYDAGLYFIRCGNFSTKICL